MLLCLIKKAEANAEPNTILEKERGEVFTNGGDIKKNLMKIKNFKIAVSFL